jgi:Tfp pilus assembly protein FimT
MVVMCIAIIMIGFTYSGFSVWQKKERVRAAARELSATLKEGRFKAIEKHTSHTVVIDNTTGQWAFHLFSDPLPHNNNFGDIDVTIAVGASDANGNMKIKRVLMTQQYPRVEIGEATSLRFDVQGFSKNGAGGLGAGQTKFKNEKGFWCKVIVSALGRVRIKCDDPWED